MELTVLLLLQLVVIGLFGVSISIAFMTLNMLSQHKSLRLQGSELYKKYRGLGLLKNLHIKVDRIPRYNWLIYCIVCLVGLMGAGIIIDLTCEWLFISELIYPILLFTNVFIFIIIDSLRTKTICDIMTMQYNSNRIAEYEANKKENEEITMLLERYGNKKGA